MVRFADAVSPWSAVVHSWPYRTNPDVHDDHV